MNPEIAKLLGAAERVGAGEPLTSDLMTEVGVPLDLRLVVAAVSLAAADQPLTKLSMTTAARAARSAAYRDHGDLMAYLKEHVPDLVQAQLGPVRREVSVTELAAELGKANETIARERTLREEAEIELAHVINYARELHWQLQPEYEAAMRERREKVRPLRSVPSAEDSSDDA
jgi:DNA-binding phage protein